MYYYEFFGKFSYLIIFLLGLSVGSFLNVWIWRTHENFRITSGRSMCPVCHRQLHWYENIPVLSFLALKGKCLTCKNPISLQYLLVEICTAILFVFLARHTLNHPTENYLYFLRNITFLIFLIVVFVYDALYQEILSEVVWLGSLIGILFNVYLGYSIASMMFGAVAVSGFFLLQFAVSKGRWIGGGDVRLGVMMGLWLGWPISLAALFIAYIVGSFTSLILLLLKKKTLRSATPFGTYLALATFVCLIWGGQIVNWYMGLL